MKLSCKNCGATISTNEHKCPYCGGFNFIGARKKYFRDLIQIKDNLSKLDEIPIESYKREASVQVKRIIKTIVICAIIVMIIYGVISLTSYLKEKSYDIDRASPKDQLLWDQKNFSMLDEWYDAGEYDKLLDYKYELYNQDPIYTFINWEHIDFLDSYEIYIYAMESKNRIESKENSSLYHITSAIYYGFDLYFNLENKGLDNDELERLKVYKTDVEALLFDTLRFTAEEALSIYEQVSVDGFLSYTKIEKLAVNYKSLLD